MNLSQKIISNVQKVLLGKPDAVRLAVSCFMAEGHLLIDDIPGVGKTTLALALAKSVGCSFQRVQFTSDLLPSDILGVSVFNQKAQKFDFKEGPIFHQIILADEVNRASPKTQSALLESMQEHQVSIDNETHALPRPFFVIATQNPHEHHGTFPLPESQLDRFMMRINLGYPDSTVEAMILKADAVHPPLEQITAVTDHNAIQQEITQARAVKVDESLDRYIVDIANATRNSELVDLGLSPRGTLALRRAAQAYAWTSERNYVIPDDIKTVAPAVVAHRLRLRGAGYNGKTSRLGDDVVREILGRLSVPV